MQNRLINVDIDLHAWFLVIVSGLPSYHTHIQRLENTCPMIYIWITQIITFSNGF